MLNCIDLKIDSNCIGALYYEIAKENLHKVFLPSRYFDEMISYSLKITKVFYEYDILHKIRLDLTIK